MMDLSRSYLVGTGTSKIYCTITLGFGLKHMVNGYHRNVRVYSDHQTDYRSVTAWDLHNIMKEVLGYNW